MPKRWIVVILLGSLWIGYSLWNPLHRNGVELPKRGGAIWVEQQWYSGVKRDGSAVSEEELYSFVDNLRSANIEQVYLAMPPVNRDGTLSRSNGELFPKLKALAPEVTFLPWVSGNPHNFSSDEQQWQENFLAEIYSLSSEGFAGVHLCFEPLDSGDQRHLRLLNYLDKHLGEDLILSQAMRRLSPIDSTPGPLKSRYWSREYYRKNMALCDESVLLCYDTALGTKKLYGSYVKRQISTALEEAALLGDHSVRIGLPAYEGGVYSNPAIENLTTSMIVLESLQLTSSALASFGGISVYKYETLNENEWKTLQNFAHNSSTF